jgi:hypothetical protein
VLCRLCSPVFGGRPSSLGCGRVVRVSKRPSPRRHLMLAGPEPARLVLGSRPRRRLCLRRGHDPEERHDPFPWFRLTRVVRADTGMPLRGQRLNQSFSADGRAPDR